jgi:hypothetical protein
MKKILIDEGVPHGIRDVLTEDDVFSVQWLGWSGIKNGDLIKRVNDGAFDVIITNDQQWPYQQQSDGWEFGVIILSTNSWLVIRSAILTGDFSMRLSAAVKQIQAGEVIHFDVGGEKT